MSYQVLARKWRPQDFSTLIGQQPVVTALRNALREGRIAHAYLFSGIRGVGKTTVARVLAKALNCERGPEVGPCNECLSCREITAGADLDVLEIDAATYSKVEQVRELTESLKYGPSRDRYKVVVLDEVHRLSRQAFDALLKIVEEPPPNLVFVFATTEIDAVPATILSRCQEFHFRRVSVAEVAKLLRHLCEQEGIRASDAALRSLARAGEGSVRDAVALLDQLATYGNHEVGDGDARRMVGGLDTALFHRILAAIVAGETGAVADLAHQVEEEGRDPRRTFSHFLAFCRDALHLALSTAPAEVELPAEEAAALATLARRAGYENILRILHLLLASESGVRHSESAGLALENAWLRAAELPKLLRVEQLLADGGAAGAGGPGPSPAGGRSPGRAPSGAGPRSEASRSVPPVAATPTPAAEPPPTAPSADPPRVAPLALVPAPASAAPAAALSTAAALASPDLERFLEEISRRRQPLAAHLANAERLELAAGSLSITIPPGDSLVGAALNRASNRQVLDEVLRALWGPSATWRLVPGGSGTAPTAAVASHATAPPPRPTALEHPAVQAVLEIFGGQVAGVVGREPIAEE